MKARRYEFHECVDTDEMFVRLWDEMRADRIIPLAGARAPAAD